MPLQVMSMRKKYKKYSGRRNPYRNNYAARKFSTKPYGRLQNIVTVPGKQVLPSQIRTQFTFNFRSSFVYTASSQTTGIGNFIANSLNDPLGASGAGQPPMFNELMTYYKNYMVIASKIELWINSRDAVPIIFYIVPIVDTTGTYSLDRVATMPGAKILYVTGDNASGASKIVNYRTTSTATGVDVGENDLQGTDGSDPNKLWYWHLSFAPIQNAYPSDFTIDTFAVVTQYCVLSNPKPVGYST